MRDVARATSVEVELPDGTSFPLALTGVVAAVVLFGTPVALGVILLAGLVRALAAAAVRPGAATVASGLAAVAASRAFASASLPVTGDLLVLLEVLVAGGAFLAVEAALSRRSIASGATVYVALLCTAALLAIAYRDTPPLALVAAAPLLVTRYSLDRSASARRTYAQTTRALSLLPEVAGLTELGHGERTAILATALAEHLELSAVAVQRVGTAARLHHIGHISLHEPEERVGPVDAEQLARVAGELLRETGFLADVAAVVEDAQEVERPADGLEAAIVRVCSTLDDAAAAGLADPLQAVVERHRVGPEADAAAALVGLQLRVPDLLDRAREASRALVAAAQHGGHGPAAHAETDDCR